MSEFLKAIGTPWIGTVMGLLGVICAFYFYYRGKALARMTYEIIETTIVGTKGAGWSDHIKVLFHDKEVPRVTGSVVKIWNSGNVTMRRSDIAEADPPMLTLTGQGRVLQAIIYASTRPVIGAEAKVLDSPTSDTIRLDFDFLDPNDGFSVMVLHTGESKVIDIKGTMIGLREGFRRVEENYRLLVGSSGLLVVLAPMILGTFVAVSLLGEPPDSASKSTLSQGVFGACLALSAFGGMFLLRNFPERIGWRRPPRELS